jgi:hypothetical protein
MRTIQTQIRGEVLARGTAEELVQAAELRGRMAARRYRDAGWDPERIAREVVADFRAELEAESFGVYADETLMAAVQRGVREVLGEIPSSSDWV